MYDDFNEHPDENELVSHVMQAALATEVDRIAETHLASQRLRLCEERLEAARKKVLGLQGPDREAAQLEVQSLEEELPTLSKNVQEAEFELFLVKEHISVLRNVLQAAKTSQREVRLGDGDGDIEGENGLRTSPSTSC
jgi:chromosome segregation ATPase